MTSKNAGQLQGRSPQEVLKTVFGYDGFRLNQQEIVEAVASGDDVFVLMPTGGGKSLCYQVPGLIRPGVAIVVSPLIALMKDQVDALKKKGVRAEYISSSQSAGQHREILRGIQAGEVDFLYVAPERLQLPRFREFLKKVEVALFAVDEAHCVSQWGHDFRNAYRAIGSVLEDFQDVPKIALTATADPATQADIVASLGLAKARCFQSSFSRPNLSVDIRKVEEDTFGPLRKFLKTQDGNAGIIYRASRRGVDETVLELTKAGLNAVGYHAGMPVEDRERAQERFLSEPEIIVVATIAFGMGIDRGDVRYVVHLEPPSTLEGYYQEIGRAGRDGLPSKALMLFDKKALGKQRQKIEANRDMDADRKAVLRSKLESIISVIETPGCRMRPLLAYFGEVEAAACGNCDHCQRPPLTRNAREQALTVMRAAIETDERYGSSTLARLLSPAPGMDEAERANTLHCYGAGRALSQDVWKSIIRQMIGTGLLAIQPERYGALKVTLAGRKALLSEDAQISLSGNWHEIAPQIEVAEYVALSEGQRDRLPEGLQESFNELRSKLSEKIDAGAVREIEIVRLLEARPETRDAIAEISDNPNLTGMADEILEVFAPKAAEELSFGIEL
ncbi:ATP-dependent DNA helicase RecQ [Salipiger sp. PrR003]|uniref:RecQ family ATP-dependent DNA helicase n=1 Tax=Salipiger sp. PrR003 TaxID=2706776 RepID=UPI0013D9CFD3|nr:RecQ family ATP-dependent DNA helicase [Salipiger sp. PrR003]NDV52755.1 RecQ family ATP-dependent DNA helicase [Salipiger sp. PrR003]